MNCLKTKIFSSETIVLTNENQTIEQLYHLFKSELKQAYQSMSISLFLHYLNQPVDDGVLKKILSIK